MARKRYRRTKPHRHPAPADVLAERIEIRPEALFDLIHHVNPTGRSSPDEARAYDTKARLQSLLIRRYGDEYVLVGKTEHEGVVSLLHRSGVKDACHAVVAELDPDAGSWVRRQLDLASLPEESSPEPRSGARGEASDPGQGSSDISSDELLSRARRALDEYDYESAERDLRLAFDLDEGDSAAALALLDLYVGVLGMDQQALELEPRLSPNVAEAAEVRSALALAAARLGDTDRALTLVKATTSTRTGEVYAVLAARAIREHDRAAAAGYLKLVARHHPTHPEIPRLSEEIEQLRVEDLQGVEEELGRRYREEGGLAVEADARDLAQRWPGSELARRILREVAAGRREAEIAGHLEIAETALGQQRFDDAARHFKAALDAGCERPDLPALVEDARTRDCQRRDQARVDSVLEQLTQTEAKGLLSYLSLPKELRGHVRTRTRHPAVAWLDELAEPMSGARPPGGGSGGKAWAQAAVAAVLALRDAVFELRQGHTAAALVSLEGHEDVVRGIGEGRRRLRQARERMDAERHDRAVQALDAACQAWDEALAERAGNLLEQVDLDALGDTDQSRAEDLLAALRHAETLKRLEQEYERHRTANDVFRARDRARQLAQAADDREPWNERVEELGQQIRAAWRLEITRERTPLSESTTAWHPHSSSRPCVGLDDEGTRLVLVTAHGDWLFVHLVDAESQQVLERLSLRTPEPLGEGLEFCRDGERLRIAAARGFVLELGIPDWEILGWFALRDLLAPDLVSESVWLLPGSSYVWQEVRRVLPHDPPQGGRATQDAVQDDFDEWRQVVVIDLEAWRICRRLPMTQATIFPVIGFRDHEHLVLRVDLEHTDSPARIYTARGSEVGAFGVQDTVEAAVLSDDGQGLVLLTLRPRIGPDGEPWYDEDDEYGELVVLGHFEAAPTGTGFRRGTEIALPDASSTRINQVATSLDQGLSFVLSTNSDLERELLAVSTLSPRGDQGGETLSPRGDQGGETLSPPRADQGGETSGKLKVLYRLPVPYNTFLLQDRHSRHVRALMLTGAAPRILALGRDAPSAGAVGVPVPALLGYFPELEPRFRCKWPTGRTGDRIEVLREEMSALRFELYAKFSRRYEQEWAHDPDAMMALYLVSFQLPGVSRDDFYKLVYELADNHPRHAGAALLVASFEARDGEWDEIVRRLRRVDSTNLDDGTAHHLRHILGLALLYADQPVEALTVFEKRKAGEGGCDLEPLIRICRMLCADSVDPADWAEGLPAAQQVVATLLEADQLRRSGDAETARLVLERPVLNHVRELQSAARLAAIYLESEPATASQRFACRYFLALYLDVFRTREGLRQEITLPGISWDKSRLADLECRSERWLETGAVTRP